MNRALRLAAIVTLALATPATAMPNAFWMFGFEFPTGRYAHRGGHNPARPARVIGRLQPVVHMVGGSNAAGFEPGGREASASERAAIERHVRGR